MCSPAGLAFVRNHLLESEVRGQSVLEVGSRNVSGLSVRPTIMSLGPSSYLGVDIELGPEVDELCDAEHLRERFGDDSFDLVITTEVIAHIRNWRLVISNLKHVVRPLGTLVVTTRSYGFPFNAWPSDYWRYELEDIETIFADLDISALEPDLDKPGVFLKASKPLRFVEQDVSDYPLWSVVKRRRARSISTRDERVFEFFYRPVQWARTSIPQPVKDAVKRAGLSRERRVVAKTRKSSTV